MPWFQVDDDYPTHPGVLATSLAARGLWATAGAWSSKRLTDVVPDHVLASFGSTPELLDELVDAQVWRRVRGGYRFAQEGLCKIPVKETVDYQRKLKTDRQNRWREGRRRRPVDASTDASFLDPVPIPKEPPPSPPQAGGSGHDGQHKHCRACGTSQRGPAPPPKPTPTPPPFSEAHPVNGHPIRGPAVEAIAAQARQAITREDT
jgi:hypothetical protein